MPCLGWYLRNEIHFSDVYRSVNNLKKKWIVCKVPERIYVNFANDPLRETSAYNYMRFNQNLDEKTYKSAKNEAVNYLHAVFLL